MLVTSTTADLPSCSRLVGRGCLTPSSTVVCNTREFPDDETNTELTSDACFVLGAKNVVPHAISPLECEDTSAFIASFFASRNFFSASLSANRTMILCSQPCGFKPWICCIASLALATESIFTNALDPRNWSRQGNTLTSITSPYFPNSNSKLCFENDSGTCLTYSVSHGCNPETEEDVGGPASESANLTWRTWPSTVIPFNRFIAIDASRACW
mmetsp:Transcript_1508/g.4945  ORF Transcript_1508/g.4945 Transcript_1508/m.4945 type:complete len:214 (-) Transcript_1508:4070-4711(-)